MKVNPVYLNSLLNKLIKIDNKYYPNPKKKDGDIGERFVKDSIKYYMWEKRFKLKNKGNRTFKIEGQYKAGKGGMGGIDFRFGFVHNNKRYDCYVETKNWRVYPLSPTKFQTEILDRYYKNANFPGCIWILTINRGYIRTIGALCRINNIHFVPMDIKITSTQLNTASLKTIMEHFLDDFDILMKSVTGVILKKPRIKNIPSPKPYDEAIILGLPPKLVAQMYSSTIGNIEKRKSQLKKHGIKVLDGRSKVARLARLVPPDDLDDIYRMIKEEYESK